MSPKFNLRYVLGISFISALGGYLFGFDFAVITGGLPFLADHYGLGASSEGATTASLAIGAMAGCVLAGKLADSRGRKPGLMLASIGVCKVCRVMSSGMLHGNSFIFSSVSTSATNGRNINQIGK